MAVRLAAMVTLVGVLVVGCGRCAENVAPARTAAEGCGGPGKTCAVDPLVAATSTITTTTTTTTAAAAPTKATGTTSTKATGTTSTKAIAGAAVTKTTRTTPKIARAGSASDRVAVTVRYEVSGVDAGGDRGAALREIVPVDETFRRDASGNAGDAVRRAADDARNVTASAPERPVSPTVDNATTASAAVANNTNVVTTNSTVAPAVVIITTTASTTAVRAKVVRNDAQVVSYVSDKYCYCDLIYGSCDIDCCCDTDCTNHDLKSFTSCSDHAESSSSIKPESILFDSSLFYVVVENVPSDYFYPERDAIESESQVATSLRNRDVFTWQHGEKSGRLPGAPPPQPHRTDPAYNSYDLTHKSLRWMYTGARGDNSSTDVKPFGLKNRAFDSLCTVEQPVEYLTAKETNCQTYVSNLTEACNNGSALSFESYFGDKGVFKVLQPIYSGSQKTEKFGLVAIRATAHHRCASADGTPYDCGHGDHHHAVYAGGACRRAVDAVEYRLRHNGTGGVRAVDVHFRHRDVTDAGRPVYVGQRFGARFDRVPTAAAGAKGPPSEPYERSGKPGYATGRPVLVAAATGRPPRPVPMGLPEPDGRGRCQPAASGRRRTVGFAEATDVRCRLRVRVPTHRPRAGHRSKRADEPPADVCRGVQNETVAALGDYDGILVASLGDPDVARWTPAVVVKPPAQPSPSADDPSSCPAVIDGVHIRVLYSYVGTLDRPRATVLGVLVNYTATAVTVTAETVRDRRDDSDNDKNVGDNDNDNGGDNDNNVGDTFAVAEIPIRATVVFVDVTRPPVRTFAEPPTYEFRLPEDFYYPFWSSSSSDGGGGSKPPDPTRPSRSSSAARNRPLFETTSIFFPTLAAIVVVRGD